MEKIKIGAQPIIWSNDDFKDLGGETPLIQCLAEMREAGYRGTELGHKFPKDSEELKGILGRYDLDLISGWHSTYLAEESFYSEKMNYAAHLQFLSEMGCKVVILAECSRRVYNDPNKALIWNFGAEVFNEDEWKKISHGLDEFSKMATDLGMTAVYHHHMGTGIQNLKQIDRLMDTTQHLQLLGDTGHLTFAGENAFEVFRKYKSRIKHVHLKNIRPEVVSQARKESWTFDKAVRAGVFTVPGDGGIDYKPIFDIMKSVNYEGWMVVEAEQDPYKANPFKYAKRGREYIHDTLGV